MKALERLRLPLLSASAHLRLSIVSKDNLMPALKDVKRITVEIAPGIGTEFVDRDRTFAQITEWAEKSMRFSVVVFGPEGFGKTVFLRQAAEVLRGFGYDVVYVEVTHLDFTAHTDVAGKLAEAASEVSGVAEVKLTYLAVGELIRRRK